MAEHKYTQDQILAKIQKLLAVANDPGANEHVAAQMAAKAQELMQAWAIEEADLEKATTGQEIKFKVGTVHSLRRMLEYWENTLALDVAAAFMVKGLRDHSKKVRYFAGREVDVDIAIYSYEQLRGTLDEMAKRAFAAEAARIKHAYGLSIYHVAQCRHYSGSHPTVFRQRWTQSWLRGAAATVGQALMAQTKAFTASSSQALVVVDQKKAEATAFALEHFGKVNNVQYKAARVYTEALQKGAEAGKLVKLKKGLGREPVPTQLDEGGAS